MRIPKNRYCEKKKIEKKNLEIKYSEIWKFRKKKSRINCNIRY